MPHQTLLLKIGLAAAVFDVLYYRRLYRRSAVRARVFAAVAVGLLGLHVAFVIRPELFGELTWAYRLYMTWVLCALLCLPVLILQEARHWKSRVPLAREDSAPTPASGETRREFLSRAADALPVLGGFGILSSIILGSREIVVEFLRLKVSDADDDLRGLRLAQISDLHIGPEIGEDYLRYVVDILQSLRADVLLITGDLIDLSNAYLPVLGRFLTRCASACPRGIISVTGNHDFFDDGARLKSALKRMPVRLLENEMLGLERGKARLRVIGLDYAWPYRGRMGKRMAVTRAAYERVIQGTRERNLSAAPTIVLNHHPADYHWLRETGVDLVLSGHTHGGQVDPELAGKGLSPARMVYRYCRGLYTYRETRLYVNRGLGHTIPIRMNCPPEITLIEVI